MVNNAFSWSWFLNDFFLIHSPNGRVDDTIVDNNRWLKPKVKRSISPKQWNSMLSSRIECVHKFPLTLEHWTHSSHASVIRIIAKCQNPSVHIVYTKDSRSFVGVKYSCVLKSVCSIALKVIGKKWAEYVHFRWCWGSTHWKMPESVQSAEISLIRPAYQHKT